VAFLAGRELVVLSFPVNLGIPVPLFYQAVVPAGILFLEPSCRLEGILMIPGDVAGVAKADRVLRIDSQGKYRPADDVGALQGIGPTAPFAMTYLPYLPREKDIALLLVPGSSPNRLSSLGWKLTRHRSPLTGQSDWLTGPRSGQEPPGTR
jgi:hypothetical protein